MKSKSFSLILALQSFSTGLLVSVYSLVFISRGLDLYQLSIIMGILSFTVIVLEVPTGIFADLYGRKFTFLLSICFTFIGTLIVLLSQSFTLLCLSVVLSGAGRALSSGSLEALYIEGFIAHNGRECLPRILTHLNVLESSGLAIGAAIGGLLPSLSDQFGLFSTLYDLNLIIKLFLSLAISILTLRCINDSFSRESLSPPKSYLANHLKTGLSLLRKQKVIIFVLISVFTTGFFFFSLETFWQPQFMDILPDRRSLWVLSVISFSYFASALIGSLIAEKLLNNRRIKAIYLFPIGRMLIAVFLIMLGHQFQIQGFVIIFSFIYFSLGLSNIPESILINDVTPDRYRASILSLGSLVLQLGALTASIVSVVIIKYTAISTLWIIASVLLILSSLVFLLLGNLKD